VGGCSPEVGGDGSCCRRRLIPGASPRGSVSAFLCLRRGSRHHAVSGRRSVSEHNRTCLWLARCSVCICIAPCASDRSASPPGGCPRRSTPPRWHRSCAQRGGGRGWSHQVPWIPGVRRRAPRGKPIEGGPVREIHPAMHRPAIHRPAAHAPQPTKPTNIDTKRLRIDDAGGAYADRAHAGIGLLPAPCVAPAPPCGRLPSGSHRR
jgi:hypothetical protein